MYKLSVTSFISFCLFLSACLHQSPGDMSFEPGVVQHTRFAQDLTWRACPPSLPKHCEMTILEGDPRMAGLFTLRIKIHEGFVMPYHTHTKDERVTVLDGNVSVAFLQAGEKSNQKQFGVGDYYVNAKGAIHTVFSDGPVFVQITGMGPWETHFIQQAEQ